MSDLDGRLAVLNPHLHEGVSLSEAARRAGVPRRTATRWLAAYQANGLDGLRRLDRVDRGSRRLPREMIELIEGMALRRPPPRVAEVHRAVSGIAAERGWPPVSYPVVRRIIAGLDRGLLALAHDGAEEYRDDFELVLRRESVHPNDIWQADHTELDVMVLDETGRPARPWLTVILDDHSRAIAGYTVFLGDPTAAADRAGVAAGDLAQDRPGWPVCGVPAGRCTAITAPTSPAPTSPRCAPTSKVQLIHSSPGKPRGRGKVERLFGTITTELLPTLPGHIPPGNHGRPVTPPALTLSELDAAVGRYIVDTYHQRVHPETGQTPLARWSAGDWLPRHARVARGAGPAAAHRRDTAEGATRRHPLPRAAVLLHHPGRVRRGTGHHPVRPTGPGRDPRLPPRTSSCAGRCPRRSPPSPCPCRTCRPPGTSGAGNCGSSSPPAAAWSSCSPNPPGVGQPTRTTRQEEHDHRRLGDPAATRLKLYRED